jgi:hypothetical protein
MLLQVQGSLAQRQSPQVLGLRVAVMKKVVHLALRQAVHYYRPVQVVQ